jgi:uncharacterized SAM-dependent methyltransferase
MKTNDNPNVIQSESQAEQIKKYLRAGNKLTPIEALNLFGCFRLGARIHDLKSYKHGHMTIKMELVKTANGKHVAQYFIPRDNGTD